LLQIFLISDDYGDPTIPPTLSPLQKELQKNTINPQYLEGPFDTKNGNHREVCIDQMYFNADGTINPVEIMFKGVEAR